MTTQQRPLYSIFTHSVGSHVAGHSLPDKLRAIARAGFEGVEMFQDDLDEFAASDEFALIYKTLTPPASPHQEKQSLAGHDEHSTTASGSSTHATTAQHRTAEAWNAHGPCSSYEAQREIVCAAHVGALCTSLGLRVLSLQPMRDVEGWRAEEKRKEALERVRSRFPVMRALGTDLLLCCSNAQPVEQLDTNVDRTVEDLRRLADEAALYGEQNTSNEAPRPLRIAFEGLSWGTLFDTWLPVYDVVRRVDRANFGLCLDSFNTLGRQFADPCSASGIQEPEAHTRAKLNESLHLLRFVPNEKIFFLQLGDARKPLDGPLRQSPNEDETRPSRMIWSRSNRLFPGEVERGAYLPTVDFAKAVLATGYAGPWSIEVFNNSLLEREQSTLDTHAQRAFNGLQWLREQVA